MRIFFTSFLFLFLIQSGISQCADVPMGLLDGSNGFVVEGDAIYDNLGHSVKGGGDVNGDGIDDIIIGAPQVDFGGNTNVGEAYVIFGSAGGFNPVFDKATLNGENGFIIRGNVLNKQLGISVSIAGDINNDGYDDVLIGDLTENVIVIFGSESDFLPLYNKSDIDLNNGIIIQKSPGSILGQNVSYAGDVNGDDIDDIVINDSTESAVVIFGSTTITNLHTSTLNADNGFVIKGLLQNDTGIANVSNAGDINNDGVDDIILGFPLYDEGDDENAGRVYILYGKHTYNAASITLENLDVLDGFFISGHGRHSHFGHSVSAAKDFNNDGTDDFIIGAPGMYRDIEFYARAGKAYVIYGRNTQFPASNTISDFDGSNSFIISGDGSHDQLGTAVDGLTDMNGDGIADIIVSAVSGGVGSQGAVYIIYGSNTPSASIQAVNIWGNTGYQVFDDTARGFSRQQFGYSVSGIGDFNDDGEEDFAVGAIRLYETALEEGRAYLFFGGNFNFEDSESPEINCPADQELHINSTLPNYSFFLEDVSDNCTEDWELTFTQLPAQGTIFTGDTEVTVSVSDRSGNSTSCSFWVRAKTEVNDISCSPEPFSVRDIDETDGIVIYGGKAMGAAGFDVDHAGDINGDGIDDFIIGAMGEDHSWVGPYEIPYHILGTAHVVFGTDSGFPPNIDLALLNGDNGFTIQNDREFRQYQRMGYAVSSAGDINKDGYDDIMVSDPLRIDSSGSRLGDVFIVFGKPSDFPPVLNTSDLNGENGFAVKGILSGEAIGVEIDNIGDFNNDSIDDIVLIAGGAPENGKCYIIYGVSSPDFPPLITVDELNGLNGMTILAGSDPSESISTSVTGLGDVNGDGIDDIAISGRHPNTKRYVIYGSGSLSSSLVLTDLNGDNGFVVNHSGEESLTRVVSRAGDVNGDGFNDMIFGYKHVLFGGNALASAIDLADLNGNNGFSVVTLGYSRIHLEYAGDFNKDGDDDIVLTARKSSENKDYAYVIYGKQNWDATIVPDSFTFLDALVIDLNLYGGRSIHLSGSYAGDVNKDGIDDVIIGIVNETSVFEFEINSNPGFAFVIFGRAITDTESPEITCLDNQMLIAGEVLPDYTSHEDVVVNDNCTLVEDITITQNPASGSAYTPGMTITLTATDISGNSADCTFLVNASDTEAPVITCPEDQELAVGDELGDYTSMATVTDNEDPSPTITQNPLPGTVFSSDMTVTLTATDASGNSADCTFAVNATDTGAPDTEAPGITCPEDQEVPCGTLVVEDYTSWATVTDNADPTPVVIQDPAPGSPFTPGMAITLIAIDVSDNSNECTFIVNVNGLTSVDAGEDVTITEGNEVTLNANSNLEGIFQWSPGNGLSNILLANPVANPTQTTTYTVTFVSEDGCAASDEVTVYVNELPEDETKYGLSPNNDGIYDFWEIKGIEAYPDNKVQIYNRWGDVVFEIEGYDNTSNFFDGRANKLGALGAGDLPSGTYFFRIHINGEHLLRKTEGYILLKR